MEYLMDALASVIKDPLEDPFLFEWIVIQSRGMKQWISIEIAKKIGVCANINYSFPKEAIEKFSSSSKFDSDELVWKIMDAIPELIQDEQFTSIRAFLEDDRDGVRLYQIACNIASLFDDYRIYRSDILAKWSVNAKTQGIQSNSSQSGSEIWGWQSALFRKLLDKGFDFYPIKLAGDLDKNILPQRISIFGISSYPPLFLSFFEELSSFIDINLFLLVPSKEFFGYSESRFIQEIDLEQSQYIEQGNPLVASFGKSGRDLQVLIENFDYHEPFSDLWQDPLVSSNTMLSYIQSDILNLYERKHGKDMEPVDVPDRNDNSISVHSCHTPMREVQVLKDQLLNFFDKNPDLMPDDVIVMMPDIESYAPLIEAVFSTEYRFSYTISDRKQRSESATIKAFLKVLDIINSRFELNTVMDLLSSRPVAEKFSIELTELDILVRYVENAGIRWGINADSKKKAGFPEFNENTWEFGLKRLLLGYAMPNGAADLFCDILPAQCPEGIDAEMFGRLALFLDTLFKCTNPFVTSKLEGRSGYGTVSSFCSGLEQILHSMIAKNIENERDFLFILDKIHEIESQSEQALFDKEISGAVILKMLEEKLSQSVSVGSFLAGGITFCNLMPMRSIPCKVVGLMGMDEKSFPRRNASRSFDLIEKFPRIGDKNARDEDRFLFLEALISARENLIITYTGSDIKDNSPIPCSNIVNELLDVMKDSFKIKSENDIICFHPLQPFSTQYFNKDKIDSNEQSDKYFSFSKNAFKISENLANRPDKKNLFMDNSLSESVQPETDITLESLCYFFKQPLEYFIKNRLGILLSEQEVIQEDREPLILSPLDKYKIGSDIFEQGIQTKQLHVDYDRYKAEGMLSFGKKGRVDLEDIFTQVIPVFEKALPDTDHNIKDPQHIDMSVNGISLSGSIDIIRGEHGRLILTFGRLNPQRLLKEWIHHLVLNTFLRDGNPLQTILIGKNQGQSKEIAQRILFPELGCKEAEQFLSDLIDCYQSGFAEPLVFFPETSFAFAKTFLKSDQDRSRKNIFSIMQQCRSKWYSPFSNTGEKVNRYTSLYFGEQDLFQDIDSFISTGFIENSMRVFQPLMEHMR